MKIVRIEVFRVDVPMKPDSVNSPEFGGDGVSAFTLGLHKHILKMHTDEGIVGLGETWKGTPAAAVRKGAEALLGTDPTRLSLHRLPLPYDTEEVNVRDRGEVVAVPVSSIPHNPAVHAFEVAVADIVGQAFGVPICQLLGGPVRDRVLVHYWSGRRTPEDLARVAKQAQERGFSGLKIKCALEDPNLERVQAVYEACGPGFRITLDPNMRFRSVEATLELAKRMEGLPVEVFEDPVAKDDLADYARLKAEMEIPLALHLERPEDVLEAIRREVAGVFNLRGTMTGFMKAAYLAEVAGLPVWRGSGLDLGILDASYAHVCAATPACTLGSDIVGNFLREDDLIVEPLVYKGSYVQVPEGPGLGVQLDEEALARYTVEREEDGTPGVWTVE
jgi:muconate cycloisomerase